MRLNVSDTIRAGLKSIFNDIAFGSDMSFAGRGASGRVYYVPGTNTDWASLVGDMWHAPAAQACMSVIWRNFVQAPPQVYTRNTEGKREAVKGVHPLIALLKTPNDEYDGNTLTRAWLLSYFFGGDAYAAIERAGRTGLPAELWWLPHKRVKAKRDKKTGVLYYEFTVGGQTQRIEKEDMVHIRFGLDPDYPLQGMAPIASVERGIYTLQQGANYAAKAMKNAGLVGGVAVPKELPPNGGKVLFNAKRFVELWQQKTTGEQAGEMLALEYPVEIQWPNVTPQNMAVDTMLDRPESDVCALFGVPPQAVGLHVGRLSKTYANMKEAREGLWEECLIPTQGDFGDQIGRQLLSQLSPNWRNEELGYDISEIRPLQPDQDALWTRYVNAFKVSAIDRATFKRGVNLPVEPGDEGAYFADVQAAQPAPEENGQTGQTGRQQQAQRQARKLLTEFYGGESRARRNGHKEWTA